MKHLIVIDDRRLRRDAFSQAEKLIKRLERIEADLKSFESEDQQLYLSWYALTFRVELNRIKELNLEYRRLTLFHNWMVAEAKRQEISVAEAYLFIKDEETRYAEGRETDRARIQADRAARDQYIESEIEKEYEAERRRHARADERARKLASDEEARFDAVAKASDSDLASICSGRARAIDLLTTLLKSATKAKHLALFIRVWELTPPKTQSEFRGLMSHAYGVEFEELLEQIHETIGRHNGGREGSRMESAQSNKSKAKGVNSGTNEDGEEAAADGSRDDFDTEYIGARGERRFRNTHEEAELIKILYRKLVRRLHPDLRGQDEVAPWRKIIWNRVQDANVRQDLQELEKLLRIVQIRGRELNEITMSEILESQVWLKEEITQINSQVKQNKNAPAWGFSRRKDYGPLRRKVEKTIMMELLDASDEVDELMAEHESLELLARAKQHDWPLGPAHGRARQSSRSRSSRSSQKTSGSSAGPRSRKRTRRP